MMMKSERMDAYKADPDIAKLMLAAEEHIRKSGLEPALLDLVRMRASQINRCAFCLDMHSKDARRLGETEQRLYVLNAWRESTLYTERERAALAWTEALTLIADTQAPEDVYEEVKKHFSDAELANLTFQITQINAWNRFNVGFRYQHP